MNVNDKRAFTFPNRQIIFKIPFPSKIFKSAKPMPTKKYQVYSETNIKHDFREPAEITKQGIEVWCNYW